MANLQKVVKVTQSQYNILASGGRVGDYVGLDDNYIYLIEDTNTYITSAGGTIDSGDLTIDGPLLKVSNGSGIHFYDRSHNTMATIGADYYGSEIIYNNENYYMPLFVNDDYALIYSEDSDYSESFSFTTGYFYINDYANTQNYIGISPRDGDIYYWNEEEGLQYTYTLPTQDGTLALTSDIINVVANPQTTTATLSGITIGNTNYKIKGVDLDITAGSESISDGTNTINVMTRDTAQDVIANKTFVRDGDTVNSYKLQFTSNLTTTNLYTRGWDFYISSSLAIGGNIIKPNSNNYTDLGSSSFLFKNAYIAGNLSDGTNSITIANIANKNDLGTASAKDFTTSVTSGSADLVTSGAVYAAIDNLPEPMVFKGTLGTGGTITDLPAASSSNEGYTYKVITAGTYASQSAKVGDVFISNAVEWVLIPAGDTDSDTWRNIKVNGTELLGSAISTGAVNFKNGSNVTITGSGSDITISATDTTYSEATTSASGLMSASDKTKLDGIATGAQVNVIETVKVNGVALTVTSKAVNVIVPQIIDLRS